MTTQPVKGDVLPVGLKVVKEGQSVQYKRGKTLTSYSSLFELTDSTNKPCSHIILYGHSGIEKTALVSQIAYLWAESKSGGTFKLAKDLKEFQYAFVISGSKVKPGMDLVDSIIDQLLCDFPKQELTDKLKERKCLFLIDECDQLVQDNSVLLEDPLLQVDTGNFVLVTCRCDVVDRLQQKYHHFTFVSKSGMSVSQIHAYIRSFYAEQPDAASALIEEINANRSMQSLASSDVPLGLPHICITWQEQKDQELESRSIQVTHVLQSMIGHMSEQVKARDEGENLDVYGVLARVGKLAIGCLFDSESSIEAKQLNLEDLEYILKLGLMQRELSLKSEHVTFIHQVFQHYCAAVFWASLFQDEMERFVYYLHKLTKKNTIHFQFLIQFCCGLAPNTLTSIAPYLLKLSEVHADIHSSTSKDVHTPLETTDQEQTVGETNSGYHFSNSKRIDSSGGMINIPEVDVILKIPKGAVKKSTLLSVTVDPMEKHPTVQTDQLILGPVISCKPDGQKFLKPVTIVVPHSGVNVTERCLQVWCKSKADDPWGIIYNGLDSPSKYDVSVIVEGNKIKLRVKHFSYFDYITAPFSRFRDWLIPPELKLEMFAYMHPAFVNMRQNVNLKLYAVRMDEPANRKMVEELEKTNPLSGMCCIPWSFVLKPNGNNLTVTVRDIDPVNKWIPARENTVSSEISYANIQVGGTGSRCEIKFCRNDEVGAPQWFEGSFQTKQDGNPNTIETIYFDDLYAQENAQVNERNNAQQEPVNAPNVQAPNDRNNAQQGPVNAPNVKAPNESTEPQRLTMASGKSALEQRNMPQCKPSNDRSQHGRNSTGQQGSPTQSLKPSDNSTNPCVKQKSSESKDSSSVITPMFVPSSITPTSKSFQGDCGPFLKKVARMIEPKWQDVAHALGEQCQDFEAEWSVCSWWPAYKMLLSWQAKLQPCEFIQLREILADAVRPVNDNLADQIIS